MLTINELLPSQQDDLRKYLHEYTVLLDVSNNRRYVVYEGQDIDYNSILTTHFLKG